MSYSLYLQRFEHGQSATMDAKAFWALVTPWVVANDPEHGFAQLRMEDGGEADVYVSGSEAKLTGIGFTHFATGAFLNLVAQLAWSLGAVVILQEGIALLSTPEEQAHLPEQLQHLGRIVTLTGTAIQATIDCA
ncbi:hypothetical protein ACFWBX_36230 [Streptomyces sp. NPDC059991]|uniref:hypothetical protein n=1 Tax=Streptomyces sp. NPDC059991 TaxID=3347028 RepID=UPI0036BC5C1E